MGGADADLVIDDTIIDIKTTKKLAPDRNYFNQLLGYYTLYCISGFDGINYKPEINNIAIYFSRYAYLHVIPLSKVIDYSTFPMFIEWFKKRA
ncbi:MAG: hypothetical protein M0012_05085 [Deltaproteobacteria bacterium]|nr:hypothetical protein [Deltaproteobacteria bacterium]